MNITYKKKTDMGNRHIKAFKNFLNEEIGQRVPKEEIRKWSKENNMDDEINEIFNTIKDTFNSEKIKKRTFIDDNLIEIIYVDKDNDIHLIIRGSIVGLGDNRAILLNHKLVNVRQYSYITFVKLFTYLRFKSQSI